MSSRKPSASPDAAFTLIELLVVITIIVVLLALLAPALDAAIYQAELAVCGARQKGIVGAATAYAAANRRFYPTRIRQGSRYTAHYLNNKEHDIRKMLKGYMSVSGFLDPLCGEGVIDLELEPDSPTDLEPTMTVADYQYYAGWKFDGLHGMIRLGDRFESRIDPSVPDIHRFNVVVGDGDLWQTNLVAASHPDDKGMMAELWYVQNANNPFLAAGLGVPGTVRLTMAYWMNRDPDRGALDLNFGFDDGAVQRFLQVDMEARETMGRVPKYNNADEYSNPFWRHVPLRQ